jgi:hypothetical protein
MAMTADSDLDREIRSTAVDFSFGEILNLHRDGEIIIRPEYQRLFRWSNEQRSRLIESVLLSLPIPPIFLIENDDGVLELIDGLQRTSSILQFLDQEAINEPELTLIGCDILKSLNGKTFDSLPTVLRLKIKRSPIRATIINKTGDQYVKYEMFKRLNTGGSLLSAQEIRNCSSRMIEGGSTFYEFIQDLAKSASFSNAISRPPDTYIERRGDEELVLRFFAATAYKDGYKGNIEEWLDSFMENILFGTVPFSLENERTRFEHVFDVINGKLGDQAFTRFNDRGEPTGRLAPAYFEAICAAVNDNIEAVTSMQDHDLLERIKSIFSDADFKAATGPGANTIEKLNARIEVATLHLS